jgi:hypothetical protein
MLELAAQVKRMLDAMKIKAAGVVEQILRRGQHVVLSTISR